MAVSFEQLCALAERLPGVERGTSYGTPALKVAGKLLARLREDGATVVLRADWEERERLMAIAPEVFFLTDHYRNHAYVLAHLDKLGADTLLVHLEAAWRQIAPKRLIASYGDSASANRQGGMANRHNQ